MAEYDNTNRGVLFKNEEKAQDSHADYQGNINVDGVEFWLNAWHKTGKNGKKFMSLSVKPKQRQTQERQTSHPSTIADMSDDIPFNNPYKGRLSYVV
jgi:hypothetical protein